MIIGTTTGSRIRFITEAFNDQGGLDFANTEVPVVPVLFNVANKLACERYFAAALGVPLRDVDRYERYAQLFVNPEKGEACVVVFRPEAIKNIKSGALVDKAGRIVEEARA